MNWAWTVALSPAPKLLLMALADIGDDHGACYPSHKWLAHKCCMSDRTVRRLLELLEAQHLLRVDARYGVDGRRSSNHYRLALHGNPPDKLTRGVVTGDHGPRIPVTPPLDSSVRVTTIDPSVEPSKKTTTDEQRGVQQGADAAGVPPKQCDAEQLVFPAIESVRRQAIELLMRNVPHELAQQILDELAGRMAIGKVRNPGRYCAALLKRAHRGDFRPDLGQNVVAARRLSEADRSGRSANPNTPVHVLRDAPLPSQLQQLLDRIRDRASQPKLHQSERSDSEPESSY